jgi:hypothetical protein
MKKQLELFSKTKTIGGFETTYKNAPADVKKILDGLDFMEDYGKLEKARKALMKKGYYLDYGLDGAVTEFRKVRTGKKVGATKKPMTTKKASSMHKDTKSHNVNIRVVSGMPEMNKNILNKLHSLTSEIANIEEIKNNFKNNIKNLEREDRPKARGIYKYYVEYLKELKTHLRELKKHIK